jgi:hypothetical protein
LIENQSLEARYGDKVEEDFAEKSTGFVEVQVVFDADADVVCRDSGYCKRD